VFQRQVRFASVIVRAGHLEAGLWLTRLADHPRLVRRLAVNRRDVVHYFRLAVESDVDAELGGLMSEAYAIGERKHLRGERPAT
jgi:hypothetical protein